MVGFAVIVPWEEIGADTLQNLIEEFVSRDGTDYGEQEVALERRAEQVRHLLRRGEAIIWFDEVTESVTIMSKQQLNDMTPPEDPLFP